MMALLQDLIEKTEPNRNYQKSDLLQIIRIFKNYDFFRDRQMELFRPKRRLRRGSSKQQSVVSNQWSVTDHRPHYRP